MQFSDFSVFTELYNECHNVILKHDHDLPKTFQLTHKQSMFSDPYLNNHKPLSISIDLPFPINEITNFMSFVGSPMLWRESVFEFSFLTNNMPL
jgi:hypothetical protein